MVARTLRRRCGGATSWPHRWYGCETTAAAQWWIQKKDKPERFEPNFAGDFAALVWQYRDKLDPISIYQGRTLARINPAKQLDFVDAGCCRSDVKKRARNCTTPSSR